MIPGCVRRDIHLSHFLYNEFNSSMYQIHKIYSDQSWEGYGLLFLGLEQNFRALEMHQFWIVGRIVVSGGEVDADCVFDYPLVAHHCFLEG